MKKTIYLLALLALTLVSCNDYLDVTPSDRQSAKQLYATRAGYYTALNGIYDGLASDELYGKAMTWEALDVISGRYNTTNDAYYYQQLAASNYGYSTISPVFSSIWQKAYELILADNILLEQADNNGGLLTDREATLMKGELYAIRAFLHLDMLRLFGPAPEGDSTALSIPYNKSTDITVHDLLPFNEVIRLIISDLDEAETLLAEDPVRTEGTLMSNDDNADVQWRWRQFRFNYYSVIALKARAYMWAGDKANALAQAKRLIGDDYVQKTFHAVDANRLLANTSNPDRVFSSEVLTGIYDRNRDEIYDDYFSSTAPSTQHLMPYATYVVGSQYSLFSNLLFGAETNDYRFQSQWEAATGTGVSGYQLCKYKAISKPDPTDASSEYYYSRMIPLIKMQEMYLIAAECEPDVNDKVKWYAAERARRGCVTPEAYYPYLVQYFGYGYDKILLSQEYMREFYGEGQAFFWLKRTVFQPGYPTGMITPYDNGASLASGQFNVRPPLPQGEMK